MKKMNKGAIAASAIVALGGVAMLNAAARPVKAAETSTGKTLVERIAERFSLDKTQVQEVFDQQRQEMEANRAAEEKTRLDQAVTDGKLTQEQEDKLIAKQKEMQDFLATLKDKTEAERRTAMESKMAELKQWATDNAIPTQYLHAGPGGRGMRHRGMGGPGMDGPGGAAGTTSSSTSSESGQTNSITTML